MAGLAILVVGLAGGRPASILGASLATVPIPAVYSYVIYHRLEDPSGRAPR